MTSARRRTRGWGWRKLRRNWSWAWREFLSALFLVGLVVLIWILFVVVRP